MKHDIPTDLWCGFLLAFAFIFFSALLGNARAGELSWLISEDGEPVVCVTSEGEPEFCRAIPAHVIGQYAHHFCFGGYTRLATNNQQEFGPKTEAINLLYR